MFGSLETGLGLDIVLWLQEHGNGLFDFAGKFLHEVGGSLFYILVLALIFWCFDKALGVRLFFALTISNLVVTALKHLFDASRPFEVSTEVRALVEQGGPSFPSGHVMIALVVWGYLAFWLKDRRVTTAVGIYVLLMSWSRMYVGVHYPQDVVGGLVFGGLFLWLYARLIDVFPAWWRKLSLYPQVAAVTAAGLVLAVLFHFSEAGLISAGALLGGSLGFIIEAQRVRFMVDGSIPTRVLRSVGGIILIIAVFFGLRVLFDGWEPHQVFRVVRYALVAAAATAGWPWLSVRLGITHT